MSSLAVADPIDKFIWKGSQSAERANFQSFAIELSKLLTVEAPRPSNGDDVEMNDYCFERGVTFKEADGSTSAGRIDLYKRGMLDWSEIDPGLVLYGPPGTGKTTLARAIAATAGLPLIATSYAEWSRDHQYGIEVMNAILATFALARDNAPCVVAIDEIDSIPSRASVPADHHATFSIVNTLLAPRTNIETAMRRCCSSRTIWARR